jgi:hypothetical protein
VIMHRGRVRFVGSIDELRDTRGRDTDLSIEVKADAEKLADVLVAAGATCKVESAVALTVSLPVDHTTDLVFRSARAHGLQIRGLGVRRETVEAAFLRVIGAEMEAPQLARGDGPETEAPRLARGDGPETEAPRLARGDGPGA